jgi:hypothetical protein
MEDIFMLNPKNLLFAVIFAAISIFCFTGCAKDPTNLSKNLKFYELSDEQISSYNKDKAIWQYPHEVVWENDKGMANFVFIDDVHKKVLLATHVNSGNGAKELKPDIKKMYEVVYSLTHPTATISLEEVPFVTEETPKIKASSNLASKVQQIASLPSYSNVLVVLAQGHVGMVTYEIFDEEGDILPTSYMYISVGLIENAVDKNGKHIAFKEIMTKLDTELSDKYIAVEKEIVTKLDAETSDKNIPVKKETKVVIVSADTEINTLKGDKRRFDIDIYVSNNKIYAMSEGDSNVIYSYTGVDLLGITGYSNSLEEQEAPAGGIAFSERRFFQGSMVGLKRIMLESTTTEATTKE